MSSGFPFTIHDKYPHFFSHFYTCALAFCRTQAITSAERVSPAPPATDALRDSAIIPDANPVPATEPEQKTSSDARISAGGEPEDNIKHEDKSRDGKHGHTCNAHTCIARTWTHARTNECAHACTDTQAHTRIRACTQTQAQKRRARNLTKRHRQTDW